MDCFCDICEISVYAEHGSHIVHAAKNNTSHALHINEVYFSGAFITNQESYLMQ